METPLKTWTNKAGSKATPIEFLLSLFELAKIRARLKGRMKTRP